MTQRMYLSVFRGEPEVMTVTGAAKLLRTSRFCGINAAGNGNTKAEEKAKKER